MPLSRGLARFNRVVTNRVSRPLAGWLPGFAVIVHRGRKSDAEYRTPVNAWLGDNDVIVALTYVGVVGFVLDRLVALLGHALTRGTA